MNGKNIVELNRRAAITSTEGIGCGPCGVTTIDAEIEIEENGEKLFISAQWVDANGAELHFDVTKESLFDYYTSDEWTEETLAETNRILEEGGKCDMPSAYPEQFAALLKMVNEKLTELEVKDVQFTEDGWYIWYCQCD